jgi:hypothetical protein
MKLKQLAFLAGGAMFASHAFAILPTDANFQNPDYTFYISGASATSKTLPKLLESGCTPDLTLYGDDGGSTYGKSWKAVYCTMKVDTTLYGAISGKRVLWVERFKGGSAWGVYPVDNNYFVEQMNLFSTTAIPTFTDANGNTVNPIVAAGTAGAAVGDTPINGVYPFHASGNRVVPTECQIGPGSAPGEESALESSTAANTTLCVTSHGGVSDVEPPMFADGTPNVPDNFPAQAAFNNLNPNKGFGVVFQPVLGEEIYKYLQTLQFAGTPCDPNDTAYAAPVDWSMDCQPSLTRSQITTLLQKVGDYNWNTLLNKPLGTVPNSGLLGVCRRVKGSGTQASYHAYFMDDPCAKNPIQGGAIGMVTEGAFGFMKVVENSSSGLVSDCMDAFYDPATFSGPIPQITTTDPKRNPIGVQSVEKQPNHSVAYTDVAYDHWSFVKVNGDRPSELDTAQVTNVIFDGKYDFFMENSLQYNNQCAGACLDAMSFLTDSIGTDDVMNGVFGAYGSEEGIFAIDGVGPAGNVNSWRGNTAADGGDTGTNLFRVSRATHNGDSCRPVVVNN